MRKLFIFYLSLLTSYFLLHSSYSATVDKVTTKITQQGTEVLIFTNAVNYNDFSLKDPPRIVLDLYETKYNIPSNRIDVKKGNLKSIRSSLFKKNTVRIVLDLEKQAQYEIKKYEGKFSILLKDSQSKSEKKELKSPEKKEFVFYKSRGKHDPFKPYIGEAEISDTLLDVNGAQLVGIMWSPENKFALLQDKGGKTFILEEGDPVLGGRLTTIGKKSVVFSLRGFGTTHKVELTILPEKK